MSPLIALVLASLATLAPATGRAPPAPLSDQDADEAAVRGELDGMRWLVFGEDEVEGANDRPLEQVVPHRRAAKGSSLLEVRTHFLPELIRYSYDL
jgi:hypothetical protein